MSDFNSSLPVRTEAAGDVIVKVGDGTTPSQQLAVDSSGKVTTKLNDGSGTSISSTSNALNVFVTGGSSSGVADKTAFTYGTTTESTMGGVYQDTSPTLTAGQQGAVRLTANRAIHINIRDASGNEKLGSSTSANSIPVVIASDQGAVPSSQSGTWTVQPGNTQNTTAWLVQDAADGTVSPGTAASKSMLAGAVFNSTPPTLTNTQQAALQANSSGALKVDASATTQPVSGTVTANAGTGNFTVTQATASNLNATVTGTVAATQSGTWTVQPGNTQNTTAWLAQDLADGPVSAGTAATKSMLGGMVYNSSAATPSSGQQLALQSDSAGNLLVNLKTAIPAGTNTIGNVNLYQGSAANSITNPFFVSNIDALGTSVDSYQTSAALAAAGTANLDYTVTAAKTWYGQQVWATASGKIKVVVGFETSVGSGTFTTFWVGFNSAAEPNILIPLPPSKTQIAGAKVRVSITNNDKTSFDVYETLSGTEI